jgi:2-phospho-L-lactate guanylyltransferase (CobY/MobA/RfbA family)
MHDMDDETRKAVLGEALMDELKAIREYVQDVPVIKRELHQVKVTVDEMNSKLTVVEAVVRGHEADIRKLKRKVAIEPLL